MYSQITGITNENIFKSVIITAIILVSTLIIFIIYSNNKEETSKITDQIVLSCLSELKNGNYNIAFENTSELAKRRYIRTY